MDTTSSELDPMPEIDKSLGVSHTKGGNQQNNGEDSRCDDNDTRTSGKDTIGNDDNTRDGNNE